MILIYPNTLSTFTGDRNIALNAGYIEIQESVYNDLIETKKKWHNGAIIDDPTYESRKAQEQAEAQAREAQEAIDNEIATLKHKLAESDYAIIKIAEGAATREEYADLIVQRQTWRNRINELEN